MTSRTRAQIGLFSQFIDAGKNWSEMWPEYLVEDFYSQPWLKRSRL
jgi:hypothetical protein